jgi:zinc D-Ala-D-Ala dipeptidase
MRPHPLRGTVCGLAVLLVVGQLARAQAPGVPGPPIEPGPFRPSELVELNRLDPTLRLDIRYATSNNFVGRPVYPEARAFLQRAAAMALVRVQSELRKEGLTLIVYDAYRPWSVTKLFWDLTPPEKRDFVADPTKGSRHNRGCAVDLTLGDANSGQPLAMPTDYDDFSERAHPDSTGGPEPARRNRDRLRAAMEREGFTVYENEWWHYDCAGWQQYPILDVPFAQVEPAP